MYTLKAHFIFLEYSFFAFIAGNGCKQFFLLRTHEANAKQIEYFINNNNNNNK